jgi:hypothetical protein
MSDRSDGFFTWVWRVNGVLLLVIAALGIMGGIALLAMMAAESREIPEQRLAKVAGADLASQDARLEEFAKVVGTELLFAPLREHRDSFGSSGYGDGLGSAQNLLFFDTATRKAHWLLSGSEQSIPSYSFLTDPPTCSRYGWSDCGTQDRPETTLALLLEIQPRSRETDAGEPRSLAVASPDGLSITKIAESTQGLLGHHQVSRDSVFVFYVKDSAARVLELDPVARIVKSDALLSAEK